MDGANAMMTILSLTIFTAAMMVVMGVMVYTLLPALPRIIAILSGTEQSPALALARPVERRRMIRISATATLPVWRAAA